MDGPMKPVDAVRELVLNRCRELRLTLADASRRIGRNESYVHQFIYRNSPKKLPEEVRMSLATLLGLPEGQLRNVTASPVTESPLAYAPHMTTVEVGGDVPVFGPGQAIDLALASEWTRRPALLAGSGPLFALWVMEDTCRFRAGDMVFVRQGQPPRIGDPIAIMEGQKVSAIGDLESRNADGSLTVKVRDDTRNFDANAKAMKIAAAAFS